MISKDEDALICDLAETYGVFDYRSLPVKTVATLSVGLREDSRIIMRLNNKKVKTNTTLLAGILDGINLLVWFKTKNGRKNINRPTSMLKTLFEDKKIKKDIKKFSSGKEFDKARSRLLKGRRKTYGD